MFDLENTVNTVKIVNTVNKVKKWQRGLSLIEAAMVLALSAVVVAGVMAYYQSASTNQKTESTISETMSLISAVNSTYSSSPDFSNISEKIIANTGALPNSYITMDTDGKTPKGIKTPNGSAVTIRQGSLSNTASAEYFTISFSVPESMCQTMVRLDLGSSLAEMGIGNPAKLVDLPVSVEKSQEVCSSKDAKKDGQVTLSYAFH